MQKFKRLLGPALIVGYKEQILSFSLVSIFFINRI